MFPSFFAGSGCIEFEEFINMMLKYMKKPEQEDIDATFRSFDVNNDGKIDKEELKRAMNTLGIKFTDEEIKAMIKEVDEDGDGEINCDGKGNYCLGRMGSISYIMMARDLQSGKARQMDRGIGKAM
jgi:Ca2+-binding EF-hand superfamily protein